MIKITWLGQGGFLLEVQNYRLVIDPYLSDNLLAVQNLARLHPFPLKLEELRPDCLVFTHDHLDHFDPETAERFLEKDGELFEYRFLETDRTPDALIFKSFNSILNSIRSFSNSLLMLFFSNFL